MKRGARHGWNGLGTVAVFPEENGPLLDHKRRAWARYRFPSLHVAALCCAAAHVGFIQSPHIAMSVQAMPGLDVYPSFLRHQVDNIVRCACDEQDKSVFYVANDMLLLAMRACRRDRNARCNFTLPARGTLFVDTVNASDRDVAAVMRALGEFVVNGERTVWWRWKAYLPGGQRDKRSGPVMPPIPV